VEHLTDRLAEVAWTHLRSLEADGGMAVVLDSGRIAAECAACWEARADRLATRAEAVTGVSEFPDLDEERPSRPAPPPVPASPLPLRRRSDAVEGLRDAAEAAEAGRAEVGVVALGPLAEHTVRTTFAANLYAVAGIRTVPVEAAPEGGSGPGLPAVVVVCGSDGRYASDGADAVAALKAAGVGRVHLAGRASALGDEVAAMLGEAGVDEFVHARSDVVDLLDRTLADLGIASPAATADGGTGR